jgi:hypothetical protein
MNRTWGTKSPHQRRRVVLRTKVRWEMLGLQDPTQLSSSPSIEDIRRQISLAARQGLCSGTVSRSQQKGERTIPVSKVPVSTRKRGAASKQA